jgi:hypothetical protein
MDIVKVIRSYIYDKRCDGALMINGKWGACSKVGDPGCPWKRGIRSVQMTASMPIVFIQARIACWAWLSFAGRSRVVITPIDVSRLWFRIPSRICKDILASCTFFVAIRAQSVLTGLASSVSASVTRPSRDCRVNSTGRWGLSASHSCRINRFSGRQINEPHPRQAILIYLY